MKLSSPSRRDEASEFKSSRPFFKVVMRPYCVRGSMMNLPSSFAKEYLEARATCSNAILKLPNGCGRTWSVLCKFKVYNHEVISSRFQAGWPAFVKDNNLKLGDVCVFVLLEDITFTFEVVIFRVSKEDKDAMNGETVMPNGRVTTLPTPKKQQQYFSMIEKAKLLEMAQFKSEYPFFKIVMYPSFLGSRYYMEVPMEFAKRNLKKEGDAILSVSDSGGYWPIQFEMRHMKSKGKVRAEFRCGWKEFAKDNELKVGDVCIFELLKRSENLFRVSILCAVDDYNDAYHKNCQGLSFVIKNFLPSFYLVPEIKFSAPIHLKIIVLIDDVSKVYSRSLMTSAKFSSASHLAPSSYGDPGDKSLVISNGLEYFDFGSPIPFLGIFS
ncbi:hypothetical protein G4B88_001893 [Cannabis sativa]|uniref:TF-B3 domain-containing protein n=1 Tax=Cannabis sativa TaxID=3483 RepID=A0A7J6HF50_CANSA|nr:hypothetical protein G4B88_001893 [Cannabis sativa]